MTDNEPRFLGYHLSAPMFNGASLEQLQSIKADLSRASFHFADDSGGEWGAASRAVASARDKIIDLQLPPMAIALLCNNELITYENILAAIFLQLYKRTPAK